MPNKLNRGMIQDIIQVRGGILRLGSTWVAREIPPPGKRLGLSEDSYDLGERGAICERWLGSTTEAHNRIGSEHEGLSKIIDGGIEICTLKEAIQVAGDLVMGVDYSKSHNGLGRLAKIFDYADRIPFHYHQMSVDAAKVNQNPKEESYYFPKGVDLGLHPETFFGVHPWIAKEENRKVILPYLRDWDSDQILKHSRAFLQVPGDGFHIPAGILHAPGTALTIEIQEDSDVYSIIQAKVNQRIIPKDFMTNSVLPEDWESYGEDLILSQINWELSGDPYFYENRHTPPLRIDNSVQIGGYESWIFYNTSKYSGKRLVVKPGASYTCIEPGVYNLLVWRGNGVFDSHPIQAGDHYKDELIVTHQKATIPHIVENVGDGELVIFKFFGPDIQPRVPMIHQKR